MDALTEFSVVIPSAAELPVLVQFREVESLP